MAAEQSIILSGLTKKEFSQIIGDLFEEKLTAAISELKPEPTAELISRKEVAEILGVSLPTLREYTLSGKIKGYRIGRRVRYKLPEVEAALTAIR